MWKDRVAGKASWCSLGPAILQLGFGSALLLLAACGTDPKGEEHAPSDSADSPTPVLADLAWQVVGAEPAENLLMIVVDGLRSGDWPEETLPHLARLLREGRAFPHHVVDSMGSQGQMASLLTGLSAVDHGVGSMHERGRSFVSPTLPWWPGTLEASGWGTLASVGTPQFGPQVGGMERGFETFLEPALLPGSFRPGELVDMVVQEAWGAALSEPTPFAALLHLADFQNPGKVPTPAVLRAAQATLQTWSSRYPALAQSAQQVGQGPEGFEEVRRALGRLRGSEVLQEFHEAVYRGQLADLDALVGRYLLDLENAGRLQDTVVALVSLRGSHLGARPTDGPAFAPEIARAPLVLWAPGRVQPGVHAGLVPTHEVPRRLFALLGRNLNDVNESFGFHREPTERDSHVVWTADFSRRAVFGTELHSEENAAAGWVTVSQSGQTLMAREGLPEAAQASWRSVDMAIQSGLSGWSMRLEFDVPQGEQLSLRWRWTENRSKGLTTSGESTVQNLYDRRTHGRAILQGRGFLEWETPRREEPLVLEWERSGDGPEWIAAQPDDSGEGQDGPLLWLLPRPPAEGTGVPSESDTSASEVRFRRDSGLWTRILVGGEPGRSVEVLSALVPGARVVGAQSPELEITTDAAHRVDGVPSRLDALHLFAPTPINTQFKELPSHQLAMAIQVDGLWTHPWQWQVQGVESVPGRASLYVPDWWPGVTESLNEGWRLHPGMSLRRLPKQRSLTPRQGLSEAAHEYVRSMGKGE